MKRPIGLGRGLSALIEEGGTPGASDAVRMIALDRIMPNPDQPRRHFEEEALSELADSIKAQGVLQPILVRPQGDTYQIIAGERRWRAAQQAQLHEIPALVRDSSDAKTAEIALIENVQREDLNALEEARAYAGLAEAFDHSQAEIGKLVGKSRSHVANMMRLLELPETIQRLLLDGSLTMGHARALIGVDGADDLAKDIVARGLSVRETEKLVREASGLPPKSAASRGAPAPDNPDLDALERQLGDILGLPVKLKHGAKGGQVQLSYRTLDQLDMICQRLSGEQI